MTQTSTGIEETYMVYGHAGELFSCTDEEVMLTGPAGTGKSRVILEYQNYLATEYPRSRHLMARLTRRSLTESGMVTFEQKVLHPAQRVKFKSSVQEYQYPNGSILAVGGLDKPEKILSSEWDTIYIQEGTEVEEDTWEMCSMRTRNGVTPLQQILGDCNAGKSTHWILQRVQNGKLRRLKTYHEDNPVYFNRDGTMTKEGERYIGKLDRLTGVRYARYRLGLWVSAEGMIYEDTWNEKHILVNNRHDIPKEWPRYLAVDFGFSHPFVCLWAAQDPDGRLHIYRQIYRTKRLVEDHAKDIKRLSRWGEKSGEPFPRAIICDHDAEDRATLERHLGLRTLPAQKNVSAGIQLVASRFKLAGDGKPRVFIYRDGLVERDRELAEAKQPTCLEEEPESYIWKEDSAGRKDEPVKENDHALDALRYLVAHFDLRPSTVTYSNQRIY